MAAHRPRPVPIKGVHRILHAKSGGWAWRMQVRWKGRTIARLFLDNAHGKVDGLRAANAASRAAHRKLRKPFGAVVSAKVRRGTRKPTGVPGIHRTPFDTGWICEVRAFRYGIRLRATVPDKAGFAAARRQLAALRRVVEAKVRALGPATRTFRLEELRKR